MSGNTLYDLYNKAKSYMVPDVEVALPHITGAYFANALITTKKKVVTEPYEVVGGDTLGKIAKAHNTTVAKIAEANSDIGNINSIVPEQIILIPSEKTEGNTIEFERVNEAVIGTSLYLIVETQNFRGRTLKVNIKQGEEAVLTEVDGVIDVDVDGERKSLLEICVGEFAETSKALNKDDLLDLAILKVGLKAPSDEERKRLIKKIKESSCQAAKLYILVDAHTGNTDIDQDLFNYYGQNEGTDSKINFWLDMEGLWFQLKTAAWHEPVKDPQRTLFNSSGTYRPRSGTFGKTRIGLKDDGTTYKKAHGGIDIFAPIGTPIYASLDGEVVKSEYMGSKANKSGYGNTIVIKVSKDDLDAARIDDYALPYSGDGEVEFGKDFGDSDDRYLLYAHLKTRSVEAGSKVIAGQQIGTGGNTGNALRVKKASNRHLHFEILDSLSRAGYYELRNRANAAFYVNFVDPDKEKQKNNKDPE